MTKQIHIRLDDSVYDAISKYNDAANISMQDAVSTAIMQFLTREMKTFLMRNIPSRRNAIHRLCR